MPQADNVKRAMLNWLTNDRFSNRQRVLVKTYGNVAYLGSYDPKKDDDIRRFHLEDGKLRSSSCGGGRSPQEDAFATACGVALSDLIANEIVTLEESSNRLIGALALYRLKEAR